MGGVIAAARAVLVDGHLTEFEHDGAPLSVLAQRLAKVPTLFAPIERGSAVVETDAGPVAVPLAAQQSQGWALGLVVGEMFVDLGVMRRPVSSTGVIVPQVLRGDCESEVRLLRLATDIGQAAHDLLGDLEAARRLVSWAEAPLVDTRNTLRAPAVFALISGMGLVTRGLFRGGFKVTPAGLIARRPGRAGRFCVATKVGAVLQSCRGL